MPKTNVLISIRIQLIQVQNISFSTHCPMQFLFLSCLAQIYMYMACSESHCVSGHLLSGLPTFFLPPRSVLYCSLQFPSGFPIPSPVSHSTLLRELLKGSHCAQAWRMISSATRYVSSLVLQLTFRITISDSNVYTFFCCSVTSQNNVRIHIITQIYFNFSFYFIILAYSSFSRLHLVNWRLTAPQCLIPFTCLINRRSCLQLLRNQFSLYKFPSLYLRTFRQVGLCEVL